MLQIIGAKVTEKPNQAQTKARTSAGAALGRFFWRIERGILEGRMGHKRLGENIGG